MKITKCGSKITFNIEDYEVTYDFKENKFLNNKNKPITISTFKHYFKNREVSDMQEVDEISKKYKDMLVFIKESLLMFSVSNVGTVLEYFRNNSYLEKVMLEILNFGLNLQDFKSILSDERLTETLSNNIALFKDICKTYLEISKEDKNKLNSFLCEMCYTVGHLQYYQNSLGFNNNIKRNYYEKVKEFIIKRYKNRDNNYYANRYRDKCPLKLIITYKLNMNQILNYFTYLQESEGIYVWSIDFLGDYLDYVKDMSDLVKNNLCKKDFYPRNYLTRSHVIHTQYKEYQRVKDRESKQIPYVYKNPLVFSNHKYSIIKPYNYLDILQEGNNMNHCVASYHNKLQNKNCEVYFMRKIDNLEESLITLEIKYENDEPILIQARGKFNSTNFSEEQKSFLSTWCKKYNIKNNL